MDLSSLSISKTLEAIVISLSNGFSIYNGHFREQGKVGGGRDQRLHFNMRVNHNLLTCLTNKSGESYKFSVLQGVGGRCQLGFETEK